MEMLASEVICIYYPVAGLVDTLGSYGIAVTPGEEIKTIKGLTEGDKEMIRKKGLEYARHCDWKERFQQWNSMIFN